MEVVAKSWLRGQDVTSLALLRIGVAILIGLSPEVLSGVALESVGPALRTPQEGLGWFAAHVPVTAALVNGARIVTAIAAVTGALGLFSRASFGLLSTVGLYLFAVTELVGATKHDMHLFWFAALLAVSPSGAALSLDAFRRRDRRDRRDDPVDVDAAVWATRALLAIVYFFPGYWKLRESGFAWALSDNLRNQMYWKWYQNAWLPPVRIDFHPMLIRGGALGVLLLELGFPLLVLSRRGRLLAVAGGLAFHVFAEQFMRLGFASLWWCYVVLLDFRPIVAWLHDETAAAAGGPAETARGAAETARGAAETARGAAAAPHADDRRVSRFAETTTALLRRPVLVLGVLLFAANVVQGFRGAVQAWPFGCYPTFQYSVGREMPDLVVAAVDGNGGERVLLDGTGGVRFRTQREWGIVWRLLGVYGGEPNGRGLRAFYEHAEGARPPPDGTRTLRFYRAEFDTTPERRGMPPVELRTALELPL